ncbi:MAG TPA: DM13 domain-containing protein [Actinomycetota bacterium]|nr:DM13 domain-containing protein [Actinomycetota bacterium]
MDASGGAGRFWSRGRLVALATVLAAAAVVVLVWFQPQKLFQDTEVNEPAPEAMGDAMDKEDDAMKKEDGAMAEEDDAMDNDAMVEEVMTLTGDFRSIDHTTEGMLTVAQADDGRYYARLEDFETENGPDLFVYLSTAPASVEGREYVEDFVNLGRLKGNIGSQNYFLPEGIDLEKYRSVVIWCRRFSSAFGAAPLEAAV